MDTTVTVTQQVNLTNAVKQHGKTSKIKKKILRSELEPPL